MNPPDGQLRCRPLQVLAIWRRPDGTYYSGFMVMGMSRECASTQRHSTGPGGEKWREAVRSQKEIKQAMELSRLWTWVMRRGRWSRDRRWKVWFVKERNQWIRQALVRGTSRPRMLLTCRGANASGPLTVGCWGAYVSSRPSFASKSGGQVLTHLGKRAWYMYSLSHLGLPDCSASDAQVTWSSPPTHRLAGPGLSHPRQLPGPSTSLPGHGLPVHVLQPS
jgi:hypothetical protein